MRRFIAAPLLVVGVEPVVEEDLPVPVGVDVGAVLVVVMVLPSANFYTELSVCVRARGKVRRTYLVVGEREIAGERCVDGSHHSIRAVPVNRNSCQLGCFL
jgi:hypothetical protein